MDVLDVLIDASLDVVLVQDVLKVARQIVITHAHQIVHLIAIILVLDNCLGQLNYKLII